MVVYVCDYMYISIAVYVSAYMYLSIAVACMVICISVWLCICMPIERLPDGSGGLSLQDLSMYVAMCM